MEKITVSRLIEWLKKEHMSNDKIVECMEYITGDKKLKTDEDKQENDREA